jgi:hypothetical protein
MKDYKITYNDTEEITVRDISPQHARQKLKNTIPEVRKINSTIPVKSK